MDCPMLSPSPFSEEIIASPTVRKKPFFFSSCICSPKDSKSKPVLGFMKVGFFSSCPNVLKSNILNIFNDITLRNSIGYFVSS